MNNLETAFLLLDELMRLYPPALEGQHHVLGVENGKLMLWLFNGDEWREYVIEKEDFNKNPIDLAREIIEEDREWV